MWGIGFADLREWSGCTNAAAVVNCKLKMHEAFFCALHSESRNTGLGDTELSASETWLIYPGVLIHAWQDSPFTVSAGKPQIQPHPGPVARAAFFAGLVEDKATKDDEILFSWSGTQHRNTDSPVRSNTKATLISPHFLPWFVVNPGLATGLNLFSFGDPLSEWKVWLENYYEYLLESREW